MIVLMAIFAPLALNAQQALPYSYGFEDNDLATDGWTTQNPSGLNASEFGIIGTAAQNGSYGFRFSSYNDRGESTQYLISPELNAPRGVVVQFSYKASASYTSGETFQVGYSTTDTNISSFTFGSENNATNTSWAQTEEILLPAGTKYVAVYYSANYQYRLYVDDFTFAEPPACIPATNLAVTTNGQTATVTWDGTAANNFIVTVNNGTPATNQTSPYTFNVDLSTTYEVVVMADCGADGTSDPASTSFTTPDCIGGRVIEYTLNDSYGDGWNGNAIQVIEGCGDIIATLTIANGSTESGTLTLCGDQYQFVWVNGSYPGETSFTFTENGTTLFTKPSSVSDGLVLYTIGTYLSIPTDLANGTPGITEVMLTWTAGGTETAWQLCVNGDESNPILVQGNPKYSLDNLIPDTEYSVQVRAYIDATTQSCWSDAVTFTTDEACGKPTDLTVSNITTNGAHLSWTGSSDNLSYMVQYSPWYPTGDDVLPTGSMQTYTFDLSAYSGTGSIVIRHYDVTNMFRLIVDNIVVKNAAGTVVYSQDFESCGGVMPSEFSNMDMDGDGYVWEIVDNSQSYVNGTYGLSSASWTQATDALWPDNWLILSGIDLGGSISFQARGQDPSFAAENFNVYVCPDSEMVEDVAATNSYDVTGLPPYTPVAWQVKGICDTYPSSYVSSFFTTLDDVLIFTKEGDWDDLSNWTDVTGNAISALPAITNKVRIDANVTIPAGVVAYAKKITLNGGTVTIADGGQLKQESTSEVIIEKHINGYGDSNNNWYFIASPLTTTRLTYIDGWSYVNALEGEYDLYAFDATASGAEWINYKSSSANAAFTSGSNNPVLVSHMGYLYANSEDTDLEFTGATAEPSYNKVVTDDFTYVEGAAYNWNGWALVGNPFTCNAYISYVADGIALEADFYTLNTDNTYSLMSSSDALAPCTGAFINYAATGAIQYSTEAPAKGMGLLNMTLSQNRGRIDQARIRFGEGFNLGKMNFRDSSKLYIQQDNVDYGVVYTENSGEMPVSFKAEANGTYTISFNSENVSFNYLRLIDNLTGTEVDLLANPSYTFSASTSDYACRFKIVFSVNTGVGEITDAPFAFISNGNLLVNGEGTLQMVDMMGRVLSTEQINGSYSKSLNLSAGVYVLRLTNGNDVKTQKIVVE